MKAHPEILLLQVVHHGVDAGSQHGSVMLVIGIRLVNGALSLAAHALHVLLVLLLDVLHPDVVDAVKQSNLQSARRGVQHTPCCYGSACAAMQAGICLKEVSKLVRYAKTRKVTKSCLLSWHATWSFKTYKGCTTLTRCSRQHGNTMLQMGRLVRQTEQATHCTIVIVQSAWSSQRHKSQPWTAADSCCCVVLRAGTQRISSVHWEDSADLLLHLAQLLQNLLGVLRLCTVVSRQVRRQGLQGPYKQEQHT